MSLINIIVASLSSLCRGHSSPVCGTVYSLCRLLQAYQNFTVKYMALT